MATRHPHPSPSTPEHPGLGVDQAGNPVVDPTANVIALTQAAVRRIDDLAEMRARLQEARIEHVDELRIADNKRLDDLRIAESRRVDEQSVSRAEYQDKLALAESKRIDAIRSVDVGAVSVASERATQQASVLANQVSTSADALRTLVATTAAAMAAQSQNLTTQFTDRLALLEKSQYENKGRTAMADPQMERLSALVEKIATAQSVTAGTTSGLGLGASILLGVVGGVGGLLGIAGVLYAVLKP